MDPYPSVHDDYEEDVLAAKKIVGVCKYLLQKKC
jgi:hypothetical protein